MCLCSPENQLFGILFFITFCFHILCLLSNSIRSDTGTSVMNLLQRCIHNSFIIIHIDTFTYIQYNTYVARLSVYSSAYIWIEVESLMEKNIQLFNCHLHTNIKKIAKVADVDRRRLCKKKKNTNHCHHYNYSLILLISLSMTHSLCLYLSIYIFIMSKYVFRKL